jgi:hypothetical protein
MIRKLILGILTGCCVYVSSFFFVVPFAFKGEQSGLAFDRMWLIHDLYFPVFELAESSNTFHLAVRQIYSTVGDPDEVSVLCYFYIYPDLHLNMGVPVE